MKNINKAVNLTGYFISLPESKVFIVGIFILGLLLGIGINLGEYSAYDLLLKGMTDGMLLLTFPAYISAVAIKLMIRRMPFRRILATTFIGECFYALAYGGGFFLTDISKFYSELIVLVGAAVVFVLWYVIARLIFVLRWRAILFAVIQLLFHLAFFMNSGVIHFDSPLMESMTKFYLSAFVLLGALYLFFVIINAPMKRTFGVSSTDAFSLFISQWLYQKKDLESVFESVGMRVRTLLSILSFERDDGKIFFVTPYVHYGPFGNLGGSEFTTLLPQKLDSKYNAKTFVFHGTVTHDLNPISSDEVDVVVDAFEDCMKKAKYSSAKVGFSQGKKEECHADALVFDDDYSFVGISRAPELTEDINFGLGLSMMSEAEKSVKNVTVVDQHNAETGEVTSFEPGDPVGFKYTEAIKDAVQHKIKKNNLELGVSQRSVESSLVGKAGIKIAVFSSSPNYVLVLIDSNGVTPEFREKIMDEVKSLGDFQVGVYTTDTHQINVVRGTLNPLKDEKQVVEEIKTGVEEAVKDMKPAKFYSCKKWFDINVLGAKQSIEIVSTVNSIVAVAKIIGPLILIAALVAVLFLLGHI